MKTLTKTMIIGAAFTLTLAACSGAQDPQSADDTMVEAATETVNLEVVQAAEAVDVVAAGQAVQATLESYAKLIDAKDVAAMEALVLPDELDFTIFEGKGKNIGWADYRDNHLAPEFDNPDLVFTKYEYSNFKTNVSGDLATATFLIDMAYTYKGKDSAVTRNGTAILKNVDGSWKVAHLHTS